MYSDFLDQLHTIDDVEQLRTELELLKAGVFQTNQNALQSVLDTQVRNWVAQGIRTDLLKEDASGQEAFLEKLIQELDHLKVIEMGLAFQPTPTVISKIQTWLRRQIAAETPAVLKVTFDPSIVGGVVITIDGVYRDFSLQKIIQQIIDQEIQKLATEMTKGPTQ